MTIVTLDQRWSCRVKRTQSFFRQNSILKYPVLYISFYITCINSFMSLYRTTSSRPDPVWLPSAVRRGLFHFRFAPLIRGLRSYGVEWAVTPPREQFIIIIIIYFNLCIKKLDKFFLGLKRVSSDFRSSRFQNLPGEHTLGHPVSSLSVLRIAY